MNDVEAPIRATVMGALNRWFIVVEEVRVTLTSGHVGFIDILAVPRDERFKAFSFAIEVKANRAMVDNGLAKWFKQASDYVGSEPAAPLPPVNSAFLWMVGMTKPDERDQLRFRAMVDLAHQFRTGVAISSKVGFAFQLGPDEVFRSRGWRDHPDVPWPGRALERLTSARQSAGTRRQVRANATSST